MVSVFAFSSMMMPCDARHSCHFSLVSNGSGYQLVVQGHDSPLLTYNITEKQMLALTDWGTNHANKLAYNTFTGIVGNDFYMPKNFVHTRRYQHDSRAAP